MPTIRPCPARPTQLVWLLALGLQIPALRALWKYIPETQWAARVLIPALAVSVTALLLRFPNRLRLERRWIVPGLFFLLVAANALLYPRADALKFQGRGSNQDDAMIGAVHALLHGTNPFETVTYNGDPPSAGPGWILLAIPFVLAHAYVLLTPVCVLVLALALRRGGASEDAPARCLLLLMTSLAFWELMVVGSDFLALASVIGLAALVLHATSQRGGWPFAAASVLFGMAVTGRFMFAYLVPLVACFLWRRDKATSVRFLIVAGGTMLALHVGFYLWNPHAYTPAWTVTKGAHMQGTGLLSIALVACALIGGWSLITVRDTRPSWLFRIWVCMVVPLGFLALGDLKGRGWDLASWEGANYLALPMPILAAAAVLAGERSREVL